MAYVVPTRELVWQALFNIISAATVVDTNGQTVPAFSTTSRRIKLMPDNTFDTVFDQPAMFLLEGNETIKQSGRGNPDIRYWEGMVWIFAKVPDGDRPGVQDFATPGASVLNPLLDAVFLTISTPDDVAGATLTLGGLVNQVYVEGEVVKIVGDLNPDGQCFAAVPVKMLVP